MTGSTTRRFLILALLCAAGAQAQPAFVVGAAVSQTGAHADLAADYARGLQLWQEELNAAGGLAGRRVELRLLDDRSEAARAGMLYAQLIRENADALIGPYGTAATLVAAAEAESARRVLINGAGWSRAVHKRSPRYVFQTAVPYNAYGAQVLELARAAGLRRAIILARDDPASTEMAAAAHASAARAGIAAPTVLPYGGGIQDFALQVDAAKAAGAEAWIAFGEAGDAAEMAKTFRKLDYAPRLFFVRGAADARLLAFLGQDAEFTLGETAYHTQAPYAGNPAFVRAFRSKWKRDPGPAGAEGYAAGQVLAEALRRAGSVDSEKLREALAGLRTGTVLGEYRVDPKTGEQLGLHPLVVQVLLGRHEIVWPQAAATARYQLPYPAWGDRRELK
ncbi:MAG TPA: ABC transporter substrate-binding protein [Burkholderiales bacterium]|nr:ABC transporter substrate-binding protein [Burkholderiales bacterium]